MTQLDLDLDVPPENPNEWHRAPDDNLYDHPGHDWMQLDDGSIWIRPASEPSS